MGIEKQGSDVASDLRVIGEARFDQLRDIYHFMIKQCSDDEAKRGST